jgi:hypothetical protein
MKTIVLLFLSGALQLSAWAAPPQLPTDVATFLEERESCDHWRGEEGYDPERRAEISWSVCTYCTGTDSRLAGLKRKYHGSKAVMSRLDELESRIEYRDMSRRQCRASRKSRWVG